MSSPLSRIAPEWTAHHPEHRLEQGRLAGAVGADDPDELARGDGEIAPVEDVDLGDVAGDDVLGLDHVGVAGASRRGRVGGRHGRSLAVVDLTEVLELVEPEFFGVEAELLDRLALAQGADVDLVVGAEVGVDDLTVAGDRRAEPSAMSRPSASTRTQSLISWTMSMSCSTNRTVRPSSFNPLMWSSRLCLSAGLTPAIGSSSMISFGSVISARAISSSLR